MDSEPVPAQEPAPEAPSEPTPEATPEATPEVPPEAPIPGNVDNTALFSLIYNWAPAAEGSQPNLYQLTLIDASGAEQQITCEGFTRVYSVNGLKGNATYTATIKASADSGATWGPSAAFPATTVLSAGTPVSGDALYTHPLAITYFWSPPTAGDAPTTYKLTLTPTSGATVEYVIDASGTTSYEATGLLDSTTYVGTIQASTDGGVMWGAAADPYPARVARAVLVAGTPIQLGFMYEAPQSVKYYWKAPTDGTVVTKYRLNVVPVGAGSPTIEYILDASEVYVSAAGLVNGETYNATIQASVDGGVTWGEGAAYASAFGLTVVTEGVVSVSCERVDATTVKIDWVIPDPVPVNWKTYLVMSHSSHPTDPTFAQYIYDINTTSISFNELNPDSLYTMGVMVGNPYGYTPEVLSTVPTL